MKGVLFIISLLLIFVLGTGCRTVPRHLVQEEVVIYYPIEYLVLDPQPIHGPYPPLPPTTPAINNPAPTRDPQPKKPGDSGSYSKRDPLQGGGKRPPGEIKTYPPVKKPVQNDRVQ